MLFVLSSQSLRFLQKDYTPCLAGQEHAIKKKKVSFFAVYSKPVTVYSILYTFSNFTLAITL